MKRLAWFALILSVSAMALRAADEEPGIRPDPRPTDLTSKRRGTNDEPKVRPDPRPLDLSAPKQATGKSMLDVDGVTLEQSEKIRAIRARAETDIQAIRDRERAEIMMVLNEQQRVEFLKRESGRVTETARRATTSPTSVPSAP
jgi:hypothetical protein